MPACGPDFQSVLKNRLAAVAVAVANVVAAAVNTIFSIIHTPAQVTAGGIFLCILLSHAYLFPGLAILVAPITFALVISLVLPLSILRFLDR